MRRHRTAALAALVLSITAGLPLAGVAHADTLDLYVDKNAEACTDTGAGSQATPYCTLPAAAAAAQAGQTVHIAQGYYPGDVHLTRSGKPGAPITFEGPDQRPDYVKPYASVGEFGGTHGFLVDGVHDVAIKHLVTRGTQDAVLVTGSTDVTLDDVTVYSSGGGDQKGTTYPSVHVTGASSGVRVTHSQIGGAEQQAILVDGGATGTVLAADDVESSAGQGLAVSGATGTVITGNTVRDTAGIGLALSHGATGTKVENNVFLESALPGGAPARLSVSADSLEGAKADYNVISTEAEHKYDWGGQPYEDLAAFRQASGQGTHDLTGPYGTLDGSQEGSVLIDSADPAALEEQATDVFGLPRVDDPLVPNSGGGYHDRGAFEFQRPPVVLSITVTPQPSTAHPLDATVDFKATSPWATGTTTSIDFGDGTPVVDAAASPLTHTFPKTGSYQVKAVSTDSLGQSTTRTLPVEIKGPAPITALLSVVQDADLLSVHAVATAAISPWPIASTTFDYGDHTPVTAQTVHSYTGPGTYTVTTTMTDTQGRTGTATSTVTIAPEFVPTKPTRVLDTRTTGTPVGPDGSYKLKVAGVADLPAAGRLTAVLVNLTATQPTAPSYVTAYPTGGTRPTVSSLNFTTGQTVANAAVVPVGPDGTITLYNHTGKVHLVADIQGYYATQLPTAGAGNFIGSFTPTRALDTRVNHSPLGANGTVKVKVRGTGLLPGTARAVVLNLTATQPTQNGYVTADPDGTPPTSSSLNFAAGQTIANQVTVPIDSDGTVTLYNHNGSVHLIADIQAYYAAPTSGVDPLRTVAPTRLLDTRTTRTTLGPGGTTRLKVRGVAGVPNDATGVLVNLTATNTTAAGFLAAYPAGTTRPNTSILNFTAGQTVPNLAFVPVSADGSIEIYNHSGTTDVLVDIQGYEN
ncbi:hypothetical protein CFP65_4768 [Kitasatospora sp. MMS16-BH015]|uniref:PKD domain-containing protein n=1 Tax=Kitasatospora sp. MMS16-BH015 TaxID=2018025 RepID=UPI000CA32D4F|nr:PKD domain-containing protein [Kitasatospora sp. MMS16-BH015]AUG79490.1 hypothetical protein CFP65_4768 [Kitasatospora sp. MMS16-BH015]